MKNTLLIALLFWFVEGQAQILNVENFRIKTDTVGWAGQLGLNFSLTKNTKSLTAISSNVHIQYKSLKSLYLIYGNYSLLLSDKENLIDNSVFHFRYNYQLSKTYIWELFVQGQKNSISKIDFRGLVGTGIRIKLSENEKYKYFLGSTLMFEHEIQTDRMVYDLWRWSNYFSLSINPKDNFSFVSTTYYQPAFENFGDYRISSQNNFITKITKSFAFNTGFNLNYDNRPIAGVPKLQYHLVSGIVYNFSK